MLLQDYYSHFKHCDVLFANFLEFSLFSFFFSFLSSFFFLSFCISWIVFFLSLFLCFCLTHSFAPFLYHFSPHNHDNQSSFSVFLLSFDNMNARVKGQLETIHLKSLLLFNFLTKSLSQDSPSVHLFSITIGSRFTAAKIKLGEMASNLSRPWRRVSSRYTLTAA